jgi:hypothetical protein
LDAPFQKNLRFWRRGKTQGVYRIRGGGDLEVDIVDIHVDIRRYFRGVSWDVKAHVSAGRVKLPGNRQRAGRPGFFIPDVVFEAEVADPPGQLSDLGCF